MVGKIILNYLIITTIVYAILYIYRDHVLTKYIAKKSECSDIEKIFNKKFVKWGVAWSLIMFIICPIQEILMFAYQRITMKMILGSKNEKDFENAVRNNGGKIFDDMKKNNEKLILDVDMSGNDII